jgi:phospholipase/carboxylesterase
MWQLEQDRLAQVRFAFPAGPVDLASDGYSDSRAWWMIDVERLMASIESGAIRDLRYETPPELAVRRRELIACIEELRGAAQLPWRQVFLGGFSQGAMLTTDVALHADEPCGGLIVWSGTLLAESTWRAAAQHQAKFPVFQSHGRFDPILPFAAAVWLQTLLQEAGFSVEFTPFNGLHEIPMPAMRGAASLIAQAIV